MDGFAAIADPTRRRIVELLGKGPMDAGSLSAGFAISRPAISRHLRVLREAGVIRSKSAAQWRIYELEPSGLDEVSVWVRRYQSFWSERLDDLERATREQP